MRNSPALCRSRRLTPHSTVALPILLTALLCLVPGRARALNDINQYKLFGHWTHPSPTNYFLGFRGAVNEKWAVATAFNASDQGVAGQGAAQVYSAVTGVWTRKLLPPLSVTASAEFGYSVAISGDVAVIGAPGNATGTGVAYLYNLATGVLLHTLTVPTGVASDALGRSVAISGRNVLVGASGYNGSRGAVYVFDLVTGGLLGRMDLGGSGVATDDFGWSVAVEGNLAFIGALGASGGKGAGYLFNIETLQQVGVFQPSSLVAGDGAGYFVAMSRGRLFLGANSRASARGSVFCALRYNTTSFTEITASDGVAGDNFGVVVAADAGMLLVGAYGVASQTGAAYLYDVGAPGTGATQVRKIQPEDAVTNQLFGVSVALCGNTALIGADNDSTQASGSGSAYLMRPLLVPCSALTKVVARGESAPGAPDTFFNILGDAFVNYVPRVAFSSTLSGLGSNANTDTGVWTTNVSPNTLHMVYKSRNVLPTGEVIQSVSPPLINEDLHVLFPMTLKVGTGITPVTAATSRRLFSQGTTGTPAQYLSNGSTVTGAPASYTGAKLLAFGETVQGDSFISDYWATAVKLTLSAALATTATNDSGVLVFSGTTAEGFREGSDTIPGGGVFYGQFTGRVGLLYNQYVFSSATTGPVGNNQIVVQKPVASGSPVIVMQKGDTAPESIGSPVISSFLGEATDGLNVALVRATLTGGTGVTTANNEGIWSRTTAGTKHQVLRKGDTVGLTGLHVGKILSAWGANFFSGQQLVLAQMAGVGVTAANDLALILVQEGSTAAAPNYFILMREGDPAQGCGTGTIGTISRVIVDSYVGSYMVLVTLAGAPLGTEQALYTGRLVTNSSVLIGDATTTSILRRPFLFLRKGWMYDDQPGRVKSISIPASNVTPSGMGGTGRANAMSWTSTLAVTVTFDNGITQVMTGVVP